MIYVDTSVWIAQHTPEIHTQAVNDWFESVDVQAIACAQWVKTEYASGLSIKHRRGDIDKREFNAAHRKFEQLCTAGPLWFDVLAEDFLQAAKLCKVSVSGLRAGDALHLACALRADCREFLSLDLVLCRNARASGLSLIEL